jgi:hypothetical protein
MVTNVETTSSSHLGVVLKKHHENQCHELTGNDNAWTLPFAKVRMEAVLRKRIVCKLDWLLIHSLLLLHICQ